MDSNNPCPCCNNPWTRQPELPFSLSCEACVADGGGVTGIDPKNLDPSVAPSADFYTHANGTWLANNPIPGEYPSWNTFVQLHDQNLPRLRGLLEALAPPAAGAAADTIESKVAAFWSSSIDEAAIEAAGLAPLAPLFAACDLAHTDRTTAVAKLHAEYGVNVFFSVGEGPDDKQSEQTLLQLHQGGLGLPDRDYYFDDDKKDKREMYIAHVAKVLELLGDNTTVAASGAEAVMRLETQLASAHLTRTERRDPETTYNRMTPAKLTALCKGGVDWPRYLQLVGKPHPKALNIDSPPALANTARVLGEATAEDLRAYLRWHVGRSCAPHLGAAFVAAHFDFFDHTLSGTKEQKVRWKRAMSMVEEALGEAVGQLYVAQYFNADAKQRALAIVEQVRQALEARLREVEWMRPATRGKALEKMAAFGVKIGYPDSWVDYTNVHVVQGDHLGNVLRARAFEHQRQMAFADAPTDRSRWLMLPQQINAYYHPNLNEIVFPAAILQPPFFDASADDAVNLGSFGAVVGHEMTHGFDDQGRQYDHRGNLSDWWEKADAEEYERRVAVQVAQAGKVEVYGKPLNGKLTCGENIADLGGLKLAYKALRASQAQTQAQAQGRASGCEVPQGRGVTARINGFTAEQRFFLAWAQLWRQNISKEQALKLVTLDPHGPNNYRANGPLANMPEFHEAWHVKPGDAMHLPAEERVDIW